jgi:hypothetical protein
VGLLLKNQQERKKEHQNSHGSAPPFLGSFIGVRFGA